MGWFAGDVRILDMVEEVTLADNCPEHWCYLTFAEQMDWGQLCHPPAGSLIPGGL